MADKVLHIMRHGTTEMNVYLSRNPYGSKGFQDPLMYDTRLTAQGRVGAARTAPRVARLAPKPELLVVSPLTRALQTAELAFGSPPGCPTIVQPLARERLYLSSDVGRPPAELAAEFPHYDFNDLADIWWHTDTPDDPAAVHLEPEDVFAMRMAELASWLAARPESCIALVSHWGCLHQLTGGSDFDNCELRSVALSGLPGVRAVNGSGAKTGGAM